jgi:hypothetical protein
VKAREKKMMKLLAVLGPMLLLAVWYGYSTMQETKARRAARRDRAQKRRQQAAGQQGASQQATSTKSAAGTGTAALPSPPPGAMPADNHATVPPAATFSGVYISADGPAQDKRMKLPWGRDPFVPPDTRGPHVTAPQKLEAPRGEKTVHVRIYCSDRASGNSGIKSVHLYYGVAPPYDDERVEGVRPKSDEKGDGDWTFTLPAPTDRPIGCFVVAVDSGRLNSITRSKPFMITPPPPDVVEVSGGSTKLTLRGISWSGGSGVALINNDVVTKGEYIAGYEIVKIVKNGVMLKRGKREVFLQLKE